MGLTTLGKNYFMNTCLTFDSHASCNHCFKKIILTVSRPHCGRPRLKFSKQLYYIQSSLGKGYSPHNCLARYAMPLRVVQWAAPTIFRKQTQVAKKITIELVIKGYYFQQFCYKIYHFARNRCYCLSRLATSIKSDQFGKK